MFVFWIRLHSAAAYSTACVYTAERLIALAQTADLCFGCVVSMQVCMFVLVCVGVDVCLCL